MHVAHSLRNNHDLSLKLRLFRVETRDKYSHCTKNTGLQTGAVNREDGRDVGLPDGVWVQSSKAKQERTGTPNTKCVTLKKTRLKLELVRQVFTKNPIPYASSPMHVVCNKENKANEAEGGCKGDIFLVLEKLPHTGEAEQAQRSQQLRVCSREYTL